MKPNPEAIAKALALPTVDLDSLGARIASSVPFRPWPGVPGPIVAAHWPEDELDARPVRFAPGRPGGPGDAQPLRLDGFRDRIQPIGPPKLAPALIEALKRETYRQVFAGGRRSGKSFFGETATDTGWPIGPTKSPTIARLKSAGVHPDDLLRLKDPPGPVGIAVARDVQRSLAEAGPLPGLVSAPPRSLHGVPIETDDRFPGGIVEVYHDRDAWADYLKDVRAWRASAERWREWALDCLDNMGARRAWFADATDDQLRRSLRTLERLEAEGPPSLIRWATKEAPAPPDGFQSDPFSPFNFTRRDQPPADGEA